MADDFHNSDLLIQDVESEYYKNRKLLIDLASDSYGRVFSDKSFSLPSDVDFFQEGLDIDLNNELFATMKPSFFLEAPFSTKTGYYKAEKAFVLRATPLIGAKLGTEASEDLRASAYFSDDLNRMDGDTIYFLNSTLDDGNTSFSVGETI